MKIDAFLSIQCTTSMLAYSDALSGVQNKN